MRQCYCLVLYLCFYIIFESVIYVYYSMQWYIRIYSGKKHLGYIGYTCMCILSIIVIIIFIIYNYNEVKTNKLRLPQCKPFKSTLYHDL